VVVGAAAGINFVAVVVVAVCIAVSGAGDACEVKAAAWIEGRHLVLLYDPKHLVNPHSGMLHGKSAAR